MIEKGDLFFEHLDACKIRKIPPYLPRNHAQPSAKVPQVLWPLTPAPLCGRHKLMTPKHKKVCNV